MIYLCFHVLKKYAIGQESSRNYSFNYPLDRIPCLNKFKLGFSSNYSFELDCPGNARSFPRMAGSICFLEFTLKFEGKEEFQLTRI